jgi:peroxiredoxin
LHASRTGCVFLSHDANQYSLATLIVSLYSYFRSNITARNSGDIGNMRKSHIQAGSIILLMILCLMPSGSLAQPVANPTLEPPPPVEVETVTPQFVEQFRTDYATFNHDSIMKWISPKRGLVQDSILMSYEATSAQMKDFVKEMKDLKSNSVDFFQGYYTGTSREKKFYKAFYQINFSLNKVAQRINIVAVFEKIGDKWFLVQTHNLRMTRGTMNTPSRESMTLQTNVLTVGERPLDFEGKTFSKTKQSRRFASTMAIKRKRPVLLNFFSRMSGDFGAQLKWAETLYPKFKGRNIYIFCVTDDEPEFVAPFIDQEKLKLAVLLDVNSLMHQDLEVDIHPYIILLDHRGVVRTISRGYNKESYGLVENLMNEIIDEANRDIALEKEGGPPINKY